jgi:hypothetical protein
VALFVPAVAVALSEFCGSSAASQLRLRLTCLLLVWPVVSGIAGLISTARVEASREQAVRTKILAAASLIARGDRILAQVIEPATTPNLKTDLLARLVRNNEIDVKPLSDQALLDAQGTLEVQLGSTGLSLPGLHLVSVARRAAVSRTIAGCVDIRSPVADGQALFEVGASGGRVAITNAYGASITVFLRSYTGSVVTRIGTLHLEAGRPSNVSVTARHTALIVGLPKGGPTTICGTV